MFDKIKSTVSNPVFQRNVAQAAGGVVSLVTTVVISRLISTAIEAGINALMDKIQSTEIPAE